MTTQLTLDDFKPHATQIQLDHPSLGLVDVYLSIVGQDSVQYRTESKRLMKERLVDTSKKTDVDKLELDNARLAACVIVGWTEDVFGPFSTEAAVDIMKDPEFSWIREQVERATQDRALFFRKPKVANRKVHKEPGLSK
jgi:hypothetical protein